MAILAHFSAKTRKKMKNWQCRSVFCIESLNVSIFYQKDVFQYFKTGNSGIYDFFNRLGLNHPYLEICRKGDFRYYSKQDIKDVLDFVIVNAYFHVNNEIFRQIGIPMGSDPAPFIANLFLYLYENPFMNKHQKEYLRRARKLCHVFRFIDDLIALNDDDEFLRCDAEIYHKEMELKPKN